MRFFLQEEGFETINGGRNWQKSIYGEAKTINIPPNWQKADMEALHDGGPELCASGSHAVCRFTARCTPAAHVLYTDASA